MTIFTLTCRYVPSVRVVQTVCFTLIPCFCLPTLFTPVYSLLSHPREYHPPLPSFFLPSPSCLSFCYLFRFSRSPLPLSLHRVIPVNTSRFHLSLYSYPSSLISSVFLSPVTLSSLPSYPPCLISSHPTFRSPFHPFPRVSV